MQVVYGVMLYRNNHVIVLNWLSIGMFDSLLGLGCAVCITRRCCPSILVKKQIAISRICVWLFQVLQKIWCQALQVAQTPALE